MKRWKRALAALLLVPLLAGFTPKEGNSRYVARVADRVLGQIVTPEMGELERVKAIYRHLVCGVSFEEPVGLDIWRYRGDPGDGAPDYVENRALSPLLFGLGSCEDYAAAMTVLCRRAGLEAQYVGGLTVSVDGVFVDHAWTAVRVDGEWYHADAQLEDNVLRDNLLTYRYFLRDDRYLLADHRWGENLAAYYGNPQNEAQAVLLERWTPPPCTAQLPSQPPERVTQAPRPDRRALEAKLAAERAAYERKHGPPPPARLEIAPPQVILVPAS